MTQFFKRDAQIALGPQDFAVLDAYRSLGAKSACAADLYLYMQKSLGRDPRLPTIYKVIVRLRNLGLLEDIGEATAPDGGRPRRLYGLTAEGRRALDLADRMLMTTLAEAACSA